MKKRDIGIGIFCLVVSIFLFWGGIRFGLGEANNPGAGIFPLIIAICLAGLSLGLIASSVRLRQKSSPRSALFTWRSVFILGLLLLFGFFVEKLGFFVCAFLTTLAILRLNGKKSIAYLLAVPLLINVIIFIGFNWLLKVRLPLGILQFLR